MDDEKVKLQIGNNIAAYRKEKGWTQAGLAMRINYSDKAISKWERGESIPDVLTMMLLAEQFGVTVNDLLASNEEAPDPKPAKKADRSIILRLCSVLVWFVALFFFVILASFHVPFCWVPFVFAVPAYAIVQLSIRSAWGDYQYNKLMISLIVWGSLLSIFVVLRILYARYFYLIFLLGIPGQIAIFLWFRMYRTVEERTEEENGEA